MPSREPRPGGASGAGAGAPLRLRGVDQVYPDGVRALDGVSLDVTPGLFGLLGPNGAGKSTLLRRVDLWDARRGALASLSGGMRQRFGIAQALLGAPHLVVDEPTAGLGPEERTRCLDLLADLAGDAVVILSTRLVAGRTVVHVLADARPDPGFEAAPAAFEDVYFATLAAPRGAAPDG